jgi:hypothetical protein
MREGISTVIKTESDADARLGLIHRDIRNLLPHGAVIVTVASHHPKRSTDQNAMFRGLAREISEHWNQTRPERTSPEAIARDLKVEYGLIATEYSPVSGKRIARITSTTEYTRTQMGKLIDATLAWAAEQRIPIDDPRRLV